MNRNTQPLISGFLDESSSLAQSERYFIVALVTVREPFSHVWSQIFKRTRQRLGKKRKARGELKFHQLDERMRQFVLGELAKMQTVDISVTVVDKAGRRVPDTAEHYGMVVGQAVFDFLQSHRQLSLTVDKRYTNDRLAGQFMTTVERIIFTLPQAIVALTMLESERSALLQVADFVAGAFNQKYNSGDSGMADLVASRVVSEKVYPWRVIKERWREK